MATAAQAQTHYFVDDRGHCDGRTPCFDTVAQGIDAAGDGDTVAIFPGVYAGDLTLDGEAGVTLRSHVEPHTELTCHAQPRPQRATLTGGLVLADGNAGISIENLIVGGSIQVFGDARGALVSGNRVQGMYLAVCNLDVVHNVFTEDLIILGADEACVLSDNSFDGANLALEPPGSIFALTVRDNYFDGGSMSLRTDIMRDSVFSQNRMDGGSIVIEGRIVRDNVFEGNGISGGGNLVLHGRASGTDGNRLLGNDVRGSVETGILVAIASEILPEISASGANEITGNTALDNAGCDIEDISHPDIDNTWSGNIFETACGTADG
ncbi:MAG: NosD domain-containing protein [Gammaproteobacteria bacterium]